MIRVLTSQAVLGDKCKFNLNLNRDKVAPGTHALHHSARFLEDTSNAGHRHHRDIDTTAMSADPLAYETPALCPRLRRRTP